MMRAGFLVPVAILFFGWGVPLGRLLIKAVLRQRHEQARQWDESVSVPAVGTPERELWRMREHLRGYDETDWDDYEAKVENILRYGHPITLNDNPGPLPRVTATEGCDMPLRSSATTISPIPDDEIRKLVNF